MGIVHCQVSLPEECASKFVFNKKNMSTIFFLYPSLVIRTPLAPAEWSLCFSVEKQLEKKTAGQVSKQKRKEMRGLFLVAKAKWSLAWTGFFSVNRSNKRYSPLRFYLQRASFSNIKYRCILLNSYRAV